MKTDLAKIVHMKTWKLANFSPIIFMCWQNNKLDTPDNYGQNLQFPSFIFC